LRIAIIGCGRVGLITGICLAFLGHRVILVDRDLHLLGLLDQGELPFYESHLGELFQSGRSSGALTFGADLGKAINETDLSFLCVSVPQLENGDSDFSFLDTAARQIAQAADSSKLVVVRSTVPVQTGEQLEHLLTVYRSKSDISFGVASNPQFLSEGTAVDDFFHPGRVLIGVRNTRVEQALREVYRPLLERTFPCPIHSDKCPATATPQLLVTKLHSAELIKQTSNAFLALKISYSNVLADLCERLDGDVLEVTKAIGLDPRIGSLFLKPGLGFGGTRLPADLRAFCHLAERLNVEAGIVQAAERVNRERIDIFFEKIQRSMWVLKGKRIALLGLAHKPGTDDVRGSPALELHARLTSAGATVRAFDPQAMTAARAACPSLVCAADAYDAAQRADALIISTDWEEFRGLDWERVRQAMARSAVFDGRNLLSPVRMRDLGFEYHSVGRPG
jgi:UDPglucose 6-dehydrogenase